MQADNKSLPTGKKQEKAGRKGGCLENYRALSIACILYNYSRNAEKERRPSAEPVCATSTSLLDEGQPFVSRK